MKRDKWHEEYFLIFMRVWEYLLSFFTCCRHGPFDNQFLQRGVISGISLKDI